MSLLQRPSVDVAAELLNRYIRLIQALSTRCSRKYCRMVHNTLKAQWYSMKIVTSY